MGNNINAVSLGLSGFVDALTNAKVDGQYAIVLENSQPRLAQDFTSDGAVTKSHFQTIASSMIGGYYEPGMEAMRIALGAPGVAQPDLERQTWATPAPPSTPIGWRSNSLRVIVFVSDEDSDIPWYAPNRAPGQNTGQVVLSPGILYAPWRVEITDTAADFDLYKAQLHMLVNPAFGITTIQLGDPLLQDQFPNLSYFSAAGTLKNYGDASPSNLLNLQARMLSTALTSRVFNILDVGNPNFINYFFLQIVEGIILCDPCTIAECDLNTGVCGNRPLCDDNNLCTIDNCTAVGEVATCSFTPIVCTGTGDPCVTVKCNRANGMCDDTAPIVCTEKTDDPCLENKCVNGGCTPKPKICPDTSPGFCKLDTCVPNVGCGVIPNPANNTCGVKAVPAPPKKKNTAAIAGGVIAAVFVIGVLLILAALWKIRDLQTDIALLDDFACTDNIKASPLYDHQGVGGENALYEAC
jgi:hypothetical protein